MTPTERQRIEKEAEELSKTDWAATDKDRRFIKGAYIAGATEEHDKARNQAIQDCIDIVIAWHAPHYSPLIDRLKSSKTNQITTGG